MRVGDKGLRLGQAETVRLLRKDRGGRASMPALREADDIKGRVRSGLGMPKLRIDIWRWMSPMRGLRGLAGTGRFPA